MMILRQLRPGRGRTGRDRPRWLAKFKLGHAVSAMIHRAVRVTQCHGDGDLSAGRQ